MKNTSWIFIFLASLLTPISGYAADKVVVIVNSSNTQSLTIADVKNIYSDTVVNWGNEKRIKVLNSPVESAGRETFSRKVLGMSANEAESVISNKKITNTIRNKPKTMRERLVVSIVARAPNAIGYVSAKSIKGKTGVKVVLTID